MPPQGRSGGRWQIPAIITGVVVAAAVVVAVVLNQGGGGGGTSGSAATPAAEPKACTLLAPSEIGPIFGTTVNQGKPNAAVAPDNCEWSMAGSGSTLSLIAASGYPTDQVVTPDASKGQQSVPGLANALYDPATRLLIVGRARHLISLGATAQSGGRTPTEDDMVRLTQLVLSRLGLSS